MSYVDGEEEAENQFERLPDDVVVNIFDKLSDIKCLCRCFMVSKRFASLVHLVQLVSIETNIFHCLSIYPSESENPQNVTLSPSSRFNLSGLLFFGKLTQIRSLNVEIPSDLMDENDSFFKWGTNFPKLDSFTVLYASSISKMMESEQEDETDNGITLEEIIRRVSFAIDRLKDALLWMGILSYVIQFKPMLESVTICDSMNKGVKLCLGGEKLVECWNSFSVIKYVLLLERGKSWILENMKVGYVPVLELPLSGCVMKRLTIVNFRMYADDGYQAGKAMVDAFAEEQSVFSEALLHILENGKDGIKAMFLLSLLNQN